MTPADLQVLLDRIMASDRPHVEKIVVAAAAISSLLRSRGMQATLVGGGAIEFYAPEAYTTSDIDLVVEGRPRAEVDAALVESGFTRSGRHWVRSGLFVEVPGSVLSDPVETVSAGGLQLRVVRREVVLADRIIGFKHWRATGYGAQAIALLAAMGSTIDEALLRDRLRREDAEDALDLLWAISRSGEPVSDARLRVALGQLDRRPPNAGGAV
jgi:hypothetical protein